jgi:hypothetical protein
MGLHVFHEPVLIKLARGVSSKVNLRFQKNLENYPGVRRSVRAKEGQFDRYPRTAGGPRTIATFRAAPSSRSASARAFASAGASRSRRFWRYWRASCRCSISACRRALGHAASTDHPPPAGRDADDRDAAVNGTQCLLGLSGARRALGKPLPVSPIGRRVQILPERLKSVVHGTLTPEMTLPAGCCRLASLSFSIVILTVRFGGREAISMRL